MFDNERNKIGEINSQKPSFFGQIMTILTGNSERKNKIEMIKTINQHFRLIKNNFEKKIKNPNIDYDETVKDLYYDLTRILELIGENNLEILDLQKDNERTFAQDLMEMRSDEFWNKRRNQLKLHSKKEFTIYIKKYLQDLEKRLENMK